MDSNPRCERCDAPLTGQAVGGLCAHCLLKLALGPPAARTATADDTAVSSAEPMPVRQFGDAESVEESANEPAAPREAVGSRIGRYQLLEEIGAGGFGVVWMAEQLEPVTRRVALKIIKMGMDTREVIARFEAERQALAMMDHPNIAKVFDAGATDTGRPFFVMELVKGIPITTFCDENHLGTRGRLRLFAEVCDAINHAHQKGIIHRDIKPSNVMVTLDGDKAVPKVIDFGIAKATQGKLTDKTLFTRFEQFIGTPAYMSPEQAGMGGLDIDTRCDIYSLGILLYELLTGKPPFDAKSLASAGYEEMRRIIREVEPPKPSSRLSTVAGDERTTLAKARHLDPGKLNRMVEPDLDWIVMKAIEKDRSRRYETVNGLALDIHRFLSNEPVSAGPPGPAYRLHKYVGRNKAMLRVAAAIATVLIAATAVSTSMALKAIEQTRRAERGEAMAKSATEQLRQEILEAAQSHRVTARNLARQGRFRDALVRLARACEYAPGSTAAAEQAVALGNTGNFHPPITTLCGHEAEVFKSHFSPAGSRIVTASYDKTARVWDAATGRLIATLSGHQKSLRNAEFSPDGARVVTASDDWTARVWDATTGQPIATLSGHQNIVKSATFSPDGSRVVTASNDQTARVWDAASGRLIVELSGHTSELNIGEFSPDSARIVTASDDDTARVWDPTTGRLLATLSGHGEDVNDVQFSPNGARIVTASEDYTARVWDTATGQLIATLAGHEHRIRNAVFSPDGCRIVTSSDDNRARVWDAATGHLIATLSGHQERLRTAEFSPDGVLIVTASDDKTARVWNSTTGRSIATLSGHQERVWSAEFSPDGARIVTNSDDHTARVWDVAMSEPTALLSGHQHRVWNAQFSPDGTRIVTNSDDKTARVWDATTGQPIATLSGHQKRVWSAQFSPDGRHVVTASLDKTARLWDATTGLVMAELVGHQAGVGSAQFSPDGARIVTASDDATARVWDASNGRPIVTLSGHGSFVWNAQFSPDSTRVVTSSDDLTARVWEAATGRLIATLAGWKDDVWILQFSPDGTRIATAAYDGTAGVWDAATGHPITTLPSMKPIVRSIQFSPDGARIVTAGDDKSVRLWDVATGRPIATIWGHRDRVRTAQFSTDGRRLVSSCWGNVFVWDAITGQLIVDLTDFPDPVHRSKRSFDGARIEHAKGVTPTIEDFTEYSQSNSSFSHHHGRINSAQFSPDGARVVTASDDRTARVWELLGTHTPPPSWFPNLLRVIAAGTLNANGELEELPASVWVSFRAGVLDAVKTDHSRYGDFARYHLTPGPDKPVRPGAKATCREAADSLISPDATQSQIGRAYALDPTHPLIQIALARFAEGRVEADFLRRYGLDRIPSIAPASLWQRAAALLAAQPGQEAEEFAVLERAEMVAVEAALAEVRHRKAMLLAGLGQNEESRAAYQALLLASAPQFRAAALPEAALMASRTGRGEEARAWLEESARAAPDDERSRRFGGWCWLILGEAGRALQHFASERSSGDAVPPNAAEIDRRLGLALALTAAGKTREALDAFHPLVAEHPSLAHPGLPRRLNWGAVETKWLVELQKSLERASGLPDFEPGPTVLEAPPDYAAGPLGHP